MDSSAWGGGGGKEEAEIEKVEEGEEEINSIDKKLRSAVQFRIWCAYFWTVRWCTLKYFKWSNWVSSGTSTFRSYLNIAEYLFKS